MCEQICFLIGVSHGLTGREQVATWTSGLHTPIYWRLGTWQHRQTNLFEAYWENKAGEIHRYSHRGTFTKGCACHPFTVCLIVVLKIHNENSLIRLYLHCSVTHSCVLSYILLSRVYLLIIILILSGLCSANKSDLRFRKYDIVSVKRSL